MQISIPKPRRKLRKIDEDVSEEMYKDDHDVVPIDHGESTASSQSQRSYTITNLFPAEEYDQVEIQTPVICVANKCELDYEEVAAGTGRLPYNASLARCKNANKE